MSTSINTDSQVNRSSSFQNDVANVTKRVIDPLNLFGGDKFGTKGASGLFPNGEGGGGDIAERLARLSKKDKASSLDTSDADAGLFSGGKDRGNSDAGGGGSAGSKGAEVGKMIGQLISKILPIVMMFL